MKRYLNLSLLGLILVIGKGEAGPLLPTQVEKVTPASGQEFGRGLAADGTTMAVATHGPAGLNTGEGRGVHVFRKTGSAWNPVKVVLRSDFARDFGISLSVSGDLLAIGAPYRAQYLDGAGDYYPGIVGRVYVYRRITTGGVEDWVEDAVLEIPGATSGSRFFGSRVQISGDSLAISSGRNSVETIRLYRRTGVGSWAATAVVGSPDPPSGLPAVADMPVPFNENFRLSGNYLVTGPVRAVTADAQSQLLIYERSTGGSNAWGLSQRVGVWPTGGSGVLVGGIGLSGNRLACRIRQYGPDGGYGFAVFERTGITGSIFMFTHQQVYDPVGPAEETIGWPVEVSGESVALVKQQDEGYISRPEVDIFTRVAASWANAFHRKVSGGVVENNQLSLTMVLEQVMIGELRTAFSSYHTRGAVEIFSNVTASGTIPISTVLSPPAQPGSKRLGEALVLRNGHLLAGDPGEDTNAADSGLVRVFLSRSRPQATGGIDWKPVATLKPPVPHAMGHFGEAVEFDGVRVFAGEPDEPNGGTVHVFNLNTGAVSTLARPVGIDAGDRFGAAISVTETVLYMAVGAPGDAGGGSVHLYSRTNTTSEWTFLKTLTKPAAVVSGNQFGAALSINGSTPTLAVAAPANNTPGSTYDGAVFIYQVNLPNPGGWGLLPGVIIKPSNPNRGIFGYSISLRGDDLLAGAWPFALFGVGRGEAFLFSRNQGGANQWGETKTLFEASPFSANPGYGASVALSSNSNFALVGAPQDDLAATDQGSGGIYERNTGGAAQYGRIALTTPWQPGVNDLCGTAVTADRNSFAASAPGDDDAGTDAGAIYLWRVGAYERWAADTGVVGAALMPPAGDYDRDGVPNLMEFALGSDPRNARSREGGLLIRREADGLLHLRLTKPPYPITGLTWIPEYIKRRHYLASGTLYDFWDDGFRGMRFVSDVASGLDYTEYPLTGGEISLPGALARLQVIYAEN